MHSHQRLMTSCVSISNFKLNFYVLYENKWLLGLEKLIHLSKFPEILGNDILSWRQCLNDTLGERTTRRREDIFFHRFIVVIIVIRNFFLRLFSFFFFLIFCFPNEIIVTLNFLFNFIYFHNFLWADKYCPPAVFELINKSF